MIELLFWVAVSFFLGLIVKLTDDLVDEKLEFKIKFLNSNYFPAVTAIIYGAIIGVSSILDTRIAVLFLGVAIANLIYGRFDNISHKIGFLAMLACFFAAGFYFEFPEINYLLFTGFIISAIVDELLNDKADALEENRERKNKKTKIKNKSNSSIKHLIIKYRIWTELFALAASIYFLDAVYFAAIFSFDIAYIGMGKLLSKKAV